MTKLRERMLQDLQLRGYSERTQQMYVRAVRKLAEHYGKSPDQITEEELRDYFLYPEKSGSGSGHVLPAPSPCAASSSSSNTPSNATGPP